MKSKSKNNWIKDAVKNKGALRKTLKVKKGDKISDAKLDKAMHSKNKKTKKRAVLAKTLEKMRK
jgi:hypothetical protein